VWYNWLDILATGCGCTMQGLRLLPCHEYGGRFVCWRFVCCLTLWGCDRLGFKYETKPAKSVKYFLQVICGILLSATVPGITLSDVGLELLTAVLMKSSTRIFWDMTPCNTFRGNISPPLSGLKNKKQELWFLPFQCQLLILLILRLQRWRQYVPLKHLLMFNGIHGVISETRDLLKFSVWFHYGF
jgi:hypothetical protein